MLYYLFIHFICFQSIEAYCSTGQGPYGENHNLSEFGHDSFLVQWALPNRENFLDAGKAENAKSVKLIDRSRVSISPNNFSNYFTLRIVDPLANQHECPFPYITPTSIADIHRNYDLHRRQVSCGKQTSSQNHSRTSYRSACLGLCR